jgi:type IV secretory pathway VirB10-like protein
MNTHEQNGNVRVDGEPVDATNEYHEASAVSQPSAPLPESVVDRARVDSEAPPAAVVTRKDLETRFGMDKRKLLLLGGGLLAAVLFFLFTALLGRSPAKNKLTHTPQQSSAAAKGSVTPLTESIRKPNAEDSNGQLSPSDIKRTRNADGSPIPRANSSPAPPATKPAAGTANTLASVPSFADTQQKWEDPKPYGSPGGTPQIQNQQQNALKEASLIFVRSQTQGTSGTSSKEARSDMDQPVLEITPGTRIQAKLETQISSAVSAPIVAVVEYTYAIGDQVVIPAGARVYGQLRQADRSGYVDVKFDEIELLDGAQEKVDAIGTALDLGPIKGEVFGKNTGKNFLVRTVSGLGSVAAMIVGNSNSTAFSEDDLLRERVAENVGTAGDSELMNLNANSRVVVSVPADTKIYIVFTKHEQTPSTLRKVSTPAQ